MKNNKVKMFIKFIIDNLEKILIALIGILIMVITLKGLLEIFNLWSIVRNSILLLLVGIFSGVYIEFKFKIINKINIFLDTSKQEQITEGHGNKPLMIKGNNVHVEDKSRNQHMSEISGGVPQQAETIINKFENKTEVKTADDALSKPEIIKNDYLYEKLEEFFRLHKITSISKDYQRAKENFTKRHYIEAAIEFKSIYSDALFLFKNSELYKNSKIELNCLEKVLEKLTDVRDKKIIDKNAKNVFSEVESAINNVFSTKTRL